ncbi:MAG: hypothetical protein QOE40_1995 [Actinomycetota bacterium]|nr:hypothetical protein [Actinomycetota bacterium]
MNGPVSAMSADEVRTVNAELDAALLTTAEQVSPQNLHDVPAEGEWSAAQVLAHLGEFPHFFAAELRRWRADPSAVIGRTHDHPARLAAVGDPGDRLDAARAAVGEAFADLADALAALEDQDVTAPTQNVKYGEEPLAAFLDRYVIGHKQGHVEQLRAAVGAG